MYTFYVKTNREKKLSPKMGFFWCQSCDRQLVACGQKCPVCGSKPFKRRMKKE